MEFIHRLGKVGKQWGISESGGKIWGTLLLIGKPLTQKEIAEHCEFSLGLVSRNLNVLLNLGIVYYSGKKGLEKLYKPSVSFISTFEKLVLNFMERDVTPIIELLENIKENEDNKEVKLRINNLINDYQRMLIFLDFFIKILEIRQETNNSNLQGIISVSIDKLLESLDELSDIDINENIATLTNNSGI